MLSGEGVALGGCGVPRGTAMGQRHLSGNLLPSVAVDSNGREIAEQIVKTGQAKHLGVINFSLDFNSRDLDDLLSDVVAVERVTLLRTGVSRQAAGMSSTPCASPSFSASSSGRRRPRTRPPTGPCGRKAEEI